MPQFYANINDGSITHLALRLLILTTVRSLPIRHCHVDEIRDDIWTIPAEKMKSNNELRVPLSQETQAVVIEAKKFARDGFLFSCTRKGVISDATMSRLMGRLGLDAGPHGFRSSFRDWCAEATNTPNEIAEMDLAHSTGGKIERSYSWMDYLEKRRILIERWSDLVAKGNSNVFQLKTS